MNKLLSIMGLLCLLIPAFGQEKRNTSSGEADDAKNITVNNVITAESLGYGKLTSRTTENSNIGRNSHEVIHVDLALNRLISVNKSKTTLPFDVPFYLTGDISRTVKSLHCFVFENNGSLEDSEDLHQEIEEKIYVARIANLEVSERLSKIDEYACDARWEFPKDYFNNYKKDELPQFSLLIDPLLSSKKYLFYFIIDYSAEDERREKLIYISLKFYHDRVFELYDLLDYDSYTPTHDELYEVIRDKNEKFALNKFHDFVYNDEIDRAFLENPIDLRSEYKISLRHLIDEINNYKQVALDIDDEYLNVLNEFNDCFFCCKLGDTIRVLPQIVSLGRKRFNDLILGIEHLNFDSSGYKKNNDFQGRKKNLRFLINYLHKLQCLKWIDACCPGLGMDVYESTINILVELANDSYKGLNNIEQQLTKFRSNTKSLADLFVEQFESTHSGIFLNLNTEANFIARAEGLITADLGFAFQFSEEYGNKIVPYFGANFNFTSINRQKKYCFWDFKKNEIWQGWRWIKPFSFTTGLTFGNDHGEDLREGFFPGTSLNLITGLGIRVTDFVRINGGLISYRSRTNNILANEMRYNSDVYLSISLDLDIERFLGNAFKTIF